MSDKEVKEEEVKIVKSQAVLADYLDMYEKRIAETLPQNIGTARRFISLLLKAARENATFYQCTLASTLGAFFTSVQLGLEPNSPMGYAYLIPYYNKKVRAYDLSFQVGYRGLVELAYRSNRIVSIDAEPVYKQDKFEFQKGTEPFLRHVPNLKKKRDDKDITAVYAIAKTREGATMFEVMSKADIELIRVRSAKKSTGEFSPWKNWWTEMAKKTVTKRLMKYLPLSPDMALAHQIDGKAEAGEAVYYDEKKKEVSNVIDGEEVDNKVQTSVNNVRNDLERKIKEMNPKEKMEIEEIEKHIERTEKSGILKKEAINDLRYRLQKRIERYTKSKKVKAGKRRVK